MDENRIRANIRRLLFEDNWVANATDDKSAGKFAIDADEEMPVPIAPSPQMAFQASADAPPVDDGDYIPSSAIDLSKALYELFKDTPDSQIEYVYRNAHKLRSSAEAKGARFKVAEPKIDDTEPLDKPVRKSTKNAPEKV